MKVKVELEFESIEEMMSHFGNTYKIEGDCKCGPLSHTVEPVEEEIETEDLGVGGSCSEPDDAHPESDGLDRHPSGRVVGKPSEGKKRRTKEEIAEDDALEDIGAAGSPPPGAGGVAEPNEEPVVGEGPPQIEDVRDALNKLCTKFDIDTGRELLNKYGASRTSDLDEAKYVEFIAEAKEKINAS
jgi:hypothetical protein